MPTPWVILPSRTYSRAVCTVHFEPFSGSDEAWDDFLRTFGDHQVFQTSAWLRFLEVSQSAHPVRATLFDGQEIVGCFAGLLKALYGVRILGSPLRGWLTPTMGLRLRRGVAPLEAVDSLASYAFRTLGCWHIEMVDPSLGYGGYRGPEFEQRGFSVQESWTYELDLKPSEDELFAGMTSACRRCVRKASKVGVQVLEADPDEFVDEYYAQLEDVFARQGLVPTYPKSRVDALIKKLHPTGRLLLLKAVARGGRWIASAMFPAMNTHMYFLGGASYRAHQSNRPNEAVFWHAMRYWKAQGIRTFDLCGRGSYKEKYGCKLVMRSRLLKARHPLLLEGRRAVEYAFWLKQRIRYHARSYFGGQ